MIEGKLRAGNGFVFNKSTKLKPIAPPPAPKMKEKNDNI
jgi:hypothetical protein